MNRLLVVSTAVISVLACATSVSARADTIKPGQEKFKVMLGGFLPAFNTDVQVDDNGQPGDDVASAMTWASTRTKPVFGLALSGGWLRSIAWA